MEKVKTRILIDTSSGLSLDDCKSLGYEIIGLPFLLDDIEYDDLKLGKDIFYEKLESANKINTSQAGIEQVISKIRDMLKTCDEILYLPITSGLSSAYNSGVVISNEKEFEGKVFCVDHRTISVPEKRLLEDINKLLEKGYSAKEIKKIIEEQAKNNIWIVVDNFNYLKKGGRVSGVVATIGNILNIKPILFSDGGKFSVVRKDRALIKSLDTMLSLVDECLGDDVSKIGSLWSLDVAYTVNLDLAKTMQLKMSEKYNLPIENVYVEELPQVVACHTGPNTIGTALYKHIAI